MRYKIIASRRFRKSFKRIAKSGNFDLDNYHKITDILENGTVLPSHFHDHSLQGNWANHRECHIESDVLLIYRVDVEEMNITFVDIGSHPYLFG